MAETVRCCEHDRSQHTPDGRCLGYRQASGSRGGRWQCGCLGWHEPKKAS